MKCSAAGWSKRRAIRPIESAQGGLHRSGLPSSGREAALSDRLRSRALASWLIAGACRLLGIISSASQQKACRFAAGLSKAHRHRPGPPIVPAPQYLGFPHLHLFSISTSLPPHAHLNGTNPSSTDTNLTRVSTSMKKASPNSHSYIDRIRSWARTKAHGPSPLSKDSSRSPTLPLSNSPLTNAQQTTNATLRNDTTSVPPFPSTDLHGIARQSSRPTANNVADNTSSDHPPPAPPPQADGQGTVIGDETPKKKNVAMRFWFTAKAIILSSYINILLVFVPIGIASKAANLQPGVVFGMNAVAIIPLAGLLSHATESVAKRMGDTIGALMNITFGNAVELIILYVLRSERYMNSANVSQHVCLPQERSRQERARSPLKGIIISIASHIIHSFHLFPMLVHRDFLLQDPCSLISLPNLTALLSQRYLVIIEDYQPLLTWPG